VTVAVSSQSPITAQGAPLLSARKELDVKNAFREVGTYRGAAEMCGVDPKTVKRAILRDEAAAVRVARRRNYESVRGFVAGKVELTRGKISAKRLLPEAIASGYEGSARNFRRLVAQEKNLYRRRQVIAGSRRPAVWSPGEYLVIDWGVQDGLHVFCAVLAWSRVRCVRFAGNERAETTLAMLAECFQILGGVPKVVLADRMGCLKGGVVADVVVPTPDYVRFASHYRFRPDFCHARDPESKGIVENLVGYAKRDLMVGLQPGADGWDLDAVNAAALAWCGEVNNPGTLRSRPSPPSVWPRSSCRCSRRCRRCSRPGCSVAVVSCARSTSCPASGSAQPATRSVRAQASPNRRVMSAPRPAKSREADCLVAHEPNGSGGYTSFTAVPEVDALTGRVRPACSGRVGRRMVR